MSSNEQQTVTTENASGASTSTTTNGTQASINAGQAKRGAARAGQVKQPNTPAPTKGRVKLTARKSCSPREIAQAQSSTAKRVPRAANKTVKTEAKKKTAVEANNNNPTYLSMITEAINELKDSRGSSRHAILKFIIQRFSLEPRTAKLRANKTIRNALNSGLIKTGKSKALFKVGDKQVVNGEKKKHRVVTAKVKPRAAIKKVEPTKSTTTLVVPVVAAAKKVSKARESLKKLAAKKSQAAKTPRAAVKAAASPIKKRIVTAAAKTTTATPAVRKTIRRFVKMTA